MNSKAILDNTLHFFVRSLFFSALFWIGSCSAESSGTQAAAQGNASNDPSSASTQHTITDEILLETSMGQLKIGLYGDAAPVSVKNFKQYVESGFYDGTIFHRVIGNFMIQGGGMDANYAKKPTQPPIKNEATNGISNATGTVAMARTGIVDSATSQFFINVVDNVFLDHRDTSPQGYGYAVFGEVTEGMETVEKIRNVPTSRRGPHANAPAETVSIVKASVVDPS